jgi:hypothetical protein
MDTGFTGDENSLVAVGHLNSRTLDTYVIFALLFKSKRDLNPGLPGNNIRPPDSISPYTGYRWTYSRGLGY